jgi:hypothetical protein
VCGCGDRCLGIGIWILGFIWKLENGYFSGGGMGVVGFGVRDEASLQDAEGFFCLGVTRDGVPGWYEAPRWGLGVGAGDGGVRVCLFLGG